MHTLETFYHRRNLRMKLIDSKEKETVVPKRGL